MLVSSSPRACGSPVIWAVQVVVEHSVLIGPESLDVDAGRAAGHGRELLPRNEPPTAPQRDQLTYAVAVTGDRERLAVLDGVHDLS